MGLIEENNEEKAKQCITYRNFTCYEASTSKEVNFDIEDDKVILFLSAASLPDLSAYANTRATTLRVTAPTFGPRSPTRSKSKHILGEI